VSHSPHDNQGALQASCMAIFAILYSDKTTPRTSWFGHIQSVLFRVSSNSHFSSNPQKPQAFQTFLTSKSIH